MVVVACFLLAAVAGEARAQRRESALRVAATPADSSPPVSTTTARIIIGTAIGTAGFVVGFLAGAGEGGPVAAVVAMPLMGSALGAALPGSRKAGCDVGTRFLRGLVGSAAGTAAAIAMAERSRGTRDAMAVAAVVTIMVTPAVGATLTMGDCRR